MALGARQGLAGAAVGGGAAVVAEGHGQPAGGEGGQQDGEGGEAETPVVREPGRPGADEDGGAGDCVGAAKNYPKGGLAIGAAAQGAGSRWGRNCSVLRLCTP